MLIVVKVSLFFFSFLILVVLTLQVCAFWTKNCCSRCIVGACCPCFCCAFFQFLFGLFTTFGALFLIVINIFYDQGDDIFEKVIKTMTNEEMALKMPPLDLSGISKEAIGSIQISDLQFHRIEFIKNVVDAKLGASLSNLISFHQLPLYDLPDIINETFSSATFNTEKVLDPLLGGLNTTFDDIIDNNDFFPSIMNIQEMVSNLQTYFDQIRNNCYTIDKEACDAFIEKANNSYYEFFISFDYQTKKGFKEVTSGLTESINHLPNIISLNVNDDFGGLLKTVGSSLSKALNTVVGVLENVDATMIIAIFNIIRVRFCYQGFYYLMAVSISAHIYMIGLWAMMILLWVRRKGMGRVAKNVSISYSYSYSISYSYSEKDKKKKKKKKKKDLSDSENTSGVESAQQAHIGGFGYNNNDSEVQRGVSERDSYGDSNYNNPYKHDDSSTQEKIDEDNEIQFNNDSQQDTDTEDSGPKIAEEFSFGNDNSQSQTNNNNNYNVDRSSSDDNTNNDDDQNAYLF
ncbi:hypothetical protein M9Y10_002871 [Tritrichomonas musculus]|uniref:Prominin n=1 Tax=Tritrichomonas musculus TaxID=1915356 RepID=A0ABR2LB60_9EUKA